VQEEGKSDFVTMLQQNGASPDSLNKLQAAMGNLKEFAKGSHGAAEKKLVGFLEAKSDKTHDEKLDATVASATQLTPIINSIQKTLIDNYKINKKDAETAVDTLGGYKNNLIEAEFKPLVAGAKNWCSARTTQVTGQKKLSEKEKAEKTKKKENIPSPKEWQKACEWGIQYKKGDDYAEKQFSATTTFQNEFDTARKAYWEAVKARYDQGVIHTGQIGKSNLEATAFKASMLALAKAEVIACTNADKKTQKTIVEGFNNLNKRRAAVYRSLEVIHCHVNHLASKTVKKSTDACIAKVKTESEYQNLHFKDMTVPDIKCPTESEILEKIRTKYPKLNFHFKGKTTDKATDAKGDLVADQGWVPTDAACKQVEGHTIKGTQCKDVTCPSGKIKKTGYDNVFTTLLNGDGCCEPPKGICANKDPKAVLCMDFLGNSVQNNDFKTGAFHASGGHESYRIPPPTLKEGAACRNGKGKCLQFSGCTAYGDLFSVAKTAGCGSGCTLSFWYTGQILVGSSNTIPGANGHGHTHSWSPGDKYTKDTGAGKWKKAEIPWTTTNHIMFEAFGHKQFENDFCKRTVIQDVLVIKK